MFPNVWGLSCLPSEIGHKALFNVSQAFFKIYLDINYSTVTIMNMSASEKLESSITTKTKY